MNMQKLFLMLLLGSILLGFLAYKVLESEQPNIILIFADDMGYADIGAFGSEINTPNLDNLAGMGYALARGRYLLVG